MKKSVDVWVDDQSLNGGAFAIAVNAPDPARVKKIVSILGASANILTVRDIRERPVIQGILAFRKRDIERILLVCDSEETRAVLPLLKMYAYVLGAGRVSVLYADDAVDDVGFLDVLSGVYSLISATLKGVSAVRQAKRELGSLLSETRSDVSFGTMNTALFIKAVPISGGAFGGAVAHFSGVVNAFSKIGVDCRVATTSTVPTVDDNITQIIVPPLPDMAPPIRVLHSASEMNLFRANAEYYSSLVKTFVSAPPDVIYQRLSLGTYCGVLLSRHLGIPLIMEYNGSEVWVADNWGTPLAPDSLTRDAEVACLRHAHLIVCVSEVLREELIERFQIEPARIVCYPNGVDPEIFDPSRFDHGETDDLRRQLDIDPRDTVVTFIGSFGRWHGVTVFAEAIAKLAREYRQWVDEHHVKFLLIGDGAYRTEAEHILNDAGASDVAVLTGAVPQALAPKYLAASDVFVSPHVANEDGSRFFGSPTKLFEYLAMQKPVLASDLDQIGEVLTESPTLEEIKAYGGSTKIACGLRLTPGDADELSEAIRFAVDNPAWRARSGEAARELVLSRYTWRHHVEAVKAGLEMLASPKEL